MTDIAQYDVIIVGGGLAGATLACGLADSGLRIALIDKNEPPKCPAGDFQLRVSSINRGSENILRRINAWQHIDLKRAFPYKKVVVCQAFDDASVEFDSAQIGEPYMGHMIENNNIVHALFNQLKEFSNVTFLSAVTISNLSINDDDAILQTQQGQLQGKLIVGADGPNSIVRRQLEFTQTKGLYGQRCIVATVHFQGDHQQSAWQRFLPTGPLGVLPLSDGVCSLAWSCETTFAQACLAQTDSEFIDSLMQALDGHLGQVTAVPIRAAFPLSFMHPNRYISNRVALIGDAAHVIHPLAGLGANLGLADAHCLAQVLSCAGDNKRIDPGSIGLLRQYEYQRKPINEITLNTMGAINSVFSERLSSLAPIRSLSLRIADRFDLGKNFMMKQAMGI